MSYVRPALVVIVAALLGCASGPPRRFGEAGLRPLEEVRALRVIDRALQEQGLRPERGRRFQLAARRDLECDVAIVGTRHCLEFVVAEDRAAFGPFLPRATRPGALVLAPGAERDRGADMLVLDDGDYRYEPNAEAVGAGRPAVLEVEDRLHRAVVDYTTWLRDNGRL